LTHQFLWLVGILVTAMAALVVRGMP
jgi:hypothetical protein